MKLSGTITKVSGPLVVANGLADANVSDVVRVGEQRLIGEILNMTGDSASIQVYEETSGLGPGAKVETTGMPLSVELGPGMLENIYDGIQRPLPEIRDLTGSNITRGIEVPALNRERVWHFDPVVQPGTAVVGGDVIGTVQETTAILHKIMVPPQMKGTIKSITGGDFTVDQTVAVLTDASGVDHELNMIQRWPVRIARPYAQKFAPNKPMNSGQRIIDTLFPLAGDEFARDAANRDIILFLQFFLQRVVDVLSRCDKAAEDDGIKTLRQQFLHVLSEEPDLRIVLASSERPRFRKKRIQFR